MSFEGGRRPLIRPMKQVPPPRRPQRRTTTRPLRKQPSGRTFGRKAGVMAAALGLVAGAAVLGLAFNAGSKDANPSATVAAPSPYGKAGMPAAQGQHTNGDDCSHDGVVGQWQLHGGRWDCLPLVQRIDEHRLGEDCSHSGVPAQWGMIPNRGWRCVDTNRDPGQHRDGEDCSHDGLPAIWQRAAQGWECRLPGDRPAQPGGPEIARPGTPGPASSVPLPRSGPAAPEPVGPQTVQPAQPYQPPRTYQSPQTYQPVEPYQPPSPPVSVVPDSGGAAPVAPLPSAPPEPAEPEPSEGPPAVQE